MKSYQSKWSEEDIRQLQQLAKANVNSEKQVMWDLVAHAFPSKTKTQLKAFFFNYIKPHQDPAAFKKNVKWDPSDDATLLRLVETHGKKWNVICKIITTHSAQQIKLRYFYIQKQGG